MQLTQELLYKLIMTDAVAILGSWVIGYINMELSDFKSPELDKVLMYVHFTSIMLMIPLFLAVIWTV